MALSQETLQHLTDFLKGVQQEAPNWAGKLQLIVDRYNAATEANLNVRQWLILHLKDMAVNEQFAAASKQLDQDIQAEREQRMKVKLEELREGVEG